MTSTEAVTTHMTLTPTAAPALSVKVEARSSSDPNDAWHLLSIKDVAARCLLSEKAVRRAIEDGELPAVKLRSRLRVSPDDLAAWIEASRTAPSQPSAHHRPRKSRPPAGTFRALLQDDGSREARA
ncbi:MAG TPA: helix-turn-helix domain-containing protein [Solirubrobacteraceae bacterium]|nr:helix-turn-helix domain-containing protein [Solirubrobacteraceae bacterium]